MVELPDVKKLRICSAVSIEYGRVTDRRTNGQMDGRTDILRQHSPRYAYMYGSTENAGTENGGPKKMKERKRRTKSA